MSFSVYIRSITAFLLRTSDLFTELCFISNLFNYFATFSSTDVFKNALEDFRIDLEGELLDRLLFKVELKVDYEFFFDKPSP